MTDYLTVSDAATACGLRDNNDVPLVQAKLTAASRAIDAFCGRNFGKASQATARIFQPRDAFVCHVDDFYDTASLVVKVDLDDDGNYETTWSSTDYEPQPRNGVVAGIEGWPYTRLRTVGTNLFPTCNRHAAVQVTAKWGWSAVPKPVEEACRLHVA